MPIDWSQCPDVESMPGKASGVWVVRGTRVPAEAIVANAHDGYTATQIAREIFPSVSIESGRRAIDFARPHEAHSA